MQERIFGSCLCGTVKFSVENAFSQIYICHCEQCRKITGADRAANAFIEPANLVWISGSEEISRFDFPGRSFSKAFCTKCGSGVPYLSSDETTFVVPLGVLQGDPKSDQANRIFSVERPTWSRNSDGFPSFKGFPAPPS